MKTSATPCSVSCAGYLQAAAAVLFSAALLPCQSGAMPPGQSPSRPRAYSLTMTLGGSEQIKVFHDGSKERIDLHTTPGTLTGSVEVRQVLFFDSSNHTAFAQDPVSHACFSAPYPSRDDLTGYDPFFIPAGAAPAMFVPAGSRMTGAQSVNGVPAKLYESQSTDSSGIKSTTKVWWSDTYGFPLKMEVDIPNTPPMVMSEIRRVVAAAPSPSLFVAPSGCKQAQGQWTPSGFQLNGQKTITLGLVAAPPRAPPSAAPAMPIPPAYTLVEISKLTEPSMITGQPSTVTIYRSGSKERVDLSIAPWAKGPDGVRESFLFDFLAHKAYTTAWQHGAPFCSWIDYTSDDAPANYDPFTNRAKSPITPAAWGKSFIGVAMKVAGPVTINGMSANAYQWVGADGKIYDELWWSQKYELALKMRMSTPFQGMQGTLEEIKRLDFSTPQAALFVVPAGCSETKGEWSDAGLAGSASTPVKAATPP